MKSFSGKHILVLGLGLHGGAIGNITYLAHLGARITVSDTKSREQLEKSIKQLAHIPTIEFLFENQDDIDLSDVDFILRNPAVPRRALTIEKARTLHIPILMDSSLFFDAVGRERIIGITGSKGKTTTSHAIYHVLKSFIPETTAVGIDGVSPLGMLEERGNNDAPIIFELSSWRLEALQENHTSPHIAVCTSIYKDHLNTYDSYEDYIHTKKQIIKDQTKDDVAILNYDDEIIRSWKNDVKGDLYWYSLAPLLEHQNGIWVAGEFVVVRLRTSPTLSFVRRGDDDVHPSPYEGEGKGDEVSVRVICHVSDIPYSSPHELHNTLPAILIALMYGATPEQIISALKTIPPLKHRMQLVRELNGVRYINDTTATMPDATISALQALQEKPLILILGGSDKNLEFNNLTKQISNQKNLIHLIWLPGTATQRMQKEVLPTTSAQSHNTENMQSAVTLANQLAQSGDIVLLSPAATSFGLFLHEFDRGDEFIEAVVKL